MKHLKGELSLAIATLVWGFAFVFQSTATEFLGAFTFNGIRFLLGAVSLIPLLFIRTKFEFDIKKCVKLGIVIGVLICLASNLQQIAISQTSVGKAGFITALYMILVPIFGYIFFKDKITKLLVVAISISLFGLFLLCGATFDINYNDIMLFVGAIFFAIQIIIVGHYASNVDAIVLSFVQYIVCGGLSLIIGLIFEDVNFAGIFKASSSILYTGILSTGFAYTMQIIGQKDCEPAVASLIMACESLVSALAGWLMLHQTLSSQELIGCALMFVAIILSQIRTKEERNERSKRMSSNNQ